MLVKYPKLWIYKCKINFYMCKIILYKCKNDMLNHIITCYTYFYLSSIKKLGYKLHLLVKSPKLWIYKCKINFYKCKLTYVKKLCVDILTCSEICLKKTKYIYQNLNFWGYLYIRYQLCTVVNRKPSQSWKFFNEKNFWKHNLNLHDK